MYHIAVQYAADERLAPKSVELSHWAEAALQNNIDEAELTIRIVSEEEMTELNSTYRHKNKPTNVLSFPAPPDIRDQAAILGDIVICASVVNAEADEQNKTQKAHWAHMTIHGVFHLLGHDHENDQEAEEMEALEINVMKTLGFPDPYATGDDIKHYE